MLPNSGASRYIDHESQESQVTRSSQRRREKHVSHVELRECSRIWHGQDCWQCWRGRIARHRVADWRSKCEGCDHVIVALTGPARKCGGTTENGAAFRTGCNEARQGASSWHLWWWSLERESQGTGEGHHRRTSSHPIAFVRLSIATTVGRAKDGGAATCMDGWLACLLADELGMALLFLVGSEAVHW